MRIYINKPILLLGQMGHFIDIVVSFLQKTLYIEVSYNNTAVVTLLFEPTFTAFIEIA